MTHDLPKIIDPQRPAEPTSPDSAHDELSGDTAHFEPGRSSRASRSRIGWGVAVCGFLLLAVGLVFGQTLGYDFVNFDDDTYVYNTSQVRGGLTTEGIVWAFTSRYASNWHPLTWISHMLDCQFYGLRPGGHHLTNLLLHAASAIVLFLVLLRVTGDLWPSAFVATVFAIHPLHVESVAWVAERKDVLSGLFFMLTLAAYVRYARLPFSWTRYLLVLALFALGLIAKSMVVTLPGVLLLIDYWPLERLGTGPLGKGAAEAGNRSAGRSSLRRLIAEKIPLFALAASTSAITLLTQQPELEMGSHFSLSSRTANAVVSYVAYLGQSCYPLGLAVFYPHPGNTLPLWKVAGALLVLAAITAGALVWRRRCPYLLVGWLWYLGMLVPVIGMVQVASQARADRYTYLPQIGLTIALAWGAAELRRSWLYRMTGRSARLTSWMTGTAAALVIACLMGCAWRQTSYWHDSGTLWTHALACTSANALAHNNLGNALIAQGKVDEALAHFAQAVKIEEQANNVDSRYAPPFCNMGVIELQQGNVEQAIAHCRRALELQPNYAEAHGNLANALIAKGEIKEAIQHYERAIEIRPNYSQSHDNLANVLVDLGNFDEAMSHRLKALELHPDLVAPHNNLAADLAAQGKTDEAMTHCRKALELDPRCAAAHSNLGVLLRRKGKTDEAIDHFRKALEIQPVFAMAEGNLARALVDEGKVEEGITHFDKALESQPADAETHFNLGVALYGLGKTREAVAHWRESARLQPNYLAVLHRLAWELAASPDESVRNGPKAVELAERAVQLSGGNDPAQLDALAAALAETGQFSRAVHIAARALSLAEIQHNQMLAASLRQRIGRYRAGVPYRETGATR